MRSVARGLGVGVEMHYLDVPADELWLRIEARNSEPPWDRYPIWRADFDRWLRVFQAPDTAELACSTPRQPDTEPLPGEGSGLTILMTRPLERSRSVGRFGMRPCSVRRGCPPSWTTSDVSRRSGLQAERLVGPGTNDERVPQEMTFARGSLADGDPYGGTEEDEMPRLCLDGTRAKLARIGRALVPTAIAALGVMSWGLTIVATASPASATPTGSGTALGDLGYFQGSPSYCYYYSNSMSLEGTLDTGALGTIDLGPWSSYPSSNFHGCLSSAIASVTYDVQAIGSKVFVGTCSGTYYSPVLSLACSDASGNGRLHNFDLTVTGIVYARFGSSIDQPFFGTYTMT